MRTAFIEQLIVEARQNPRVFLAVGDLGFSVVEPFAAEFPDRFLNAGVAEQNMTGVAAGLASEGWHVFTYSIANFPTLRCLEQIRNDVCYHQLPVTVVAVGGGLAYGNLGYSHHAVQDLAIMRTLLNMTVLAPADPGEVRECMQWLVANPGPSYLRLGKAGEANLHGERGVHAGPILVKEGQGDTAIVATGAILQVAIEASLEVAKKGQSIAVYSIPWLKPVTREFFRPLAKYKRLIAIEEHVGAGGLADLMREHVPGVAVEAFCVSEAAAHQVGSQDYLRNLIGLSGSRVAASLQPAE